MENVKQLQEAWFKINEPIGKQLGYPECCIKEFCDQPPEVLQKRYPTKDDYNRYQAGCINKEFTGFIPCVNHTNQILKKEITLHDLIKERSLFLPKFPNA